MNPPTPRLAASLFATLLCSPLSAQVTQRVSVGSDEEQGISHSFFPSISADGRFVGFMCLSDNLVPGDTNQASDVFVRDLQAGTTELVSYCSDGGQVGLGFGCSMIGISGNGRYVLFGTDDPYVVPGDWGVDYDAFVRDRQLGTTEIVSLAWDGAFGNDSSYAESISADGRFVTFRSYASNLVPGDTSPGAFLRDRQLRTTERIVGGGEGSSVSGDGRYVAFAGFDVFRLDRQDGTTKLVSVATDGGQANEVSFLPAISEDGRFVAFLSFASNLVPGDTNLFSDVFVRDCVSGAMERVSVATDGTQSNGGDDPYSEPSISADGRFVSFGSDATNLVPGDTNGVTDIFVHDRRTGATTRVSVDSSGAGGNQTSYRARHSISGDGRYVAFASFASNLVAGDTNRAVDAFVHDRAATSFTSLCDPGIEGVAVCPCSNAPSTPGRGCDNSAATGGAVLSASGIAYLSLDELVFTTSGEKPTALSILTQWAGENSTGVVDGMGVRCTSGPFRRMYVKRAVGGSIVAPDFNAGDLPVSALSGFKGDTIQAGESRWYVVYYRDPVVLGVCPAASTFNATQTGRVDWSL